MSLSFSRFVSAPQFVCYGDDDGGTVTGGDSANTSNTNTTPAGKTFTQEDVNKFLAEEKRKSQAQLKRAEDALAAVSNNQQLTEAERNALNASIEDIQAQMRTKEQQAALDKKKLESEYQSKLTDAERRAKAIEEKYIDSTIRRSLQDAATEGGAFQPSQVVELLRSRTKLVDDKPMVDFEDRHAETGEPIITQMSPMDAVKRMKELGAIHGNLFKNNVVSGIGGGSRADGANIDGVIDVKKLNPAQYAKLRKENPEAIGLRRS